jgi:hypothetical protein
MAPTSDASGAPPVRLFQGTPYVSIVGLVALLTAAAVWGATSQRLTEVEKKQREADARVEAIAQTIATKVDVQRVEDRLDTVINMLVNRTSKELP